MVLLDPGIDGHERPELWSEYRLIERCLQKNPRNRLRHIGDARNLLEEIAQGPRGWRVGGD